MYWVCQGSDRQTRDVVSILGIDVSAERVARWVDYLAPNPQPFIVGADSRWDPFVEPERSLTWEARHTFRVWSAPKGSRLIWLTDSDFRSLPKEDRAVLVREQVVRRNGNRPGIGRVPSVREWSDILDPGLLRAEAEGHRFVWWPRLVATAPERILARLVPQGRLASRHEEVEEETWEACSADLPYAQRVAGTWPPLGEPSCCFSTVLEAAGAETSGSCSDTAVFEAWLQSACRPSGGTDRPGTVLVWRVDEKPFHAAVCIGDGWTLEQPSADWHAPRAVARTTDVIRAARSPGQRLERHAVTA